MKKALLLLIVLCATRPVWAQETVLTHDAYLETIRERLPEIRQLTLSRQSAEQNIVKARSVSNLTLSSSALYSSTYETTMAGGENANGTSYSAGLSKLIAETGTEVSVSGAHQGSETESGIKAYSSSVGVTVRQPVLKNFLGKVDRYAADDAGFVVEITDLQNRMTERELIAAYEKLYCQWVLYRQYSKLAGEAVQNSEATLQLVLRRFQAGLAENDDVQKARVALFNYRNQYAQYQLTLDTIVNEITTVTGQQNLAPDDNSLESAFAGIAQKEYDLYSFDKSSDYQVMRKTMERYLRSLDYYDHSRLPELNLVGSYSSISGKEDERNRSYTLDEKEYYGGFEISYAFGDTATDAEYEKARLQIESLKEEMRSTENTWRTDLLNKVSSISRYREMLVLKQGTLEALQSRYATETVKYRQSRLDLQYLLDTYNSIISERINMANVRYQLIALDIDYRNLVQ